MISWQAIYSIFEGFLTSCQKLYQVDDCFNIDEILVHFLQRSYMIFYMAKEPGKYGLIVGAVCDIYTFYFQKGCNNSIKVLGGIGLLSEGKMFLVYNQSVLRLTKPFQGTKRNVSHRKWWKIALALNNTTLGRGSSN